MKTTQAFLVDNPHLRVSFLKSKAMYIWIDLAIDIVPQQMVICFKVIYVNFPQVVLFE